MKDLDFDELDKAVNSLMAGVKDTPTSQEGEKTHTVPPAVTSAPSAPTSLSEKPPVVTSSPAARRPGRFMDVVHPSAAIRKTEAAPSVSRQGVTIEPEPSVDTQEPIVQKRDLSSDDKRPEEATPSIPAEPLPSSLSAAELHKETGDWPDPLDLAESKEIQGKPKEEPNVLPPVYGPNEETPPPLTSPFLPDTKVEKRPLGANITTETTNLPLQEDTASQLPALPEDVEPILPEELHGDVMAIESDTTQKQETDKLVSDTPSDDASKKAVPLPLKAEDEAPKITGPISITQQYREEPSSSPKENGPIYDTDTYHQPLSHPTKQKSGWMWIVWIVLILVGGAGIGAALYFLGIV